MRHWKKLGGRPASHRSRRDGEAGVTLIEMMVVLVIIALVAAIIAALLARHYGEELEQRVAEAHAAAVAE